MELIADLRAPCRADELFGWIDDLERYPQWMGLVHGARSVPSQPGEGLAWDVELRARVGPFARSKRLRMVRTVHEIDRGAVFERHELDGRSHSTWRLTAQIEEDPDQGGCTLEMGLHYGGSLWTGGCCTTRSRPAAPT
ncbi:MAG TPA: SRPBCC family protein [Ilumatobacteraceae bacterium]|nr:SRPBCC family protein [Ilumatobacteraceae bacterium]